MLSQVESTAVIAIRADRILHRRHGVPQAITRDEWDRVWYDASRRLIRDDIIQFNVLTALCECGWAFID